MLLRDLNSSSTSRLNRVNKLLKNTYGIELSTNITSSGKLSSIKESLLDDIKKLKYNNVSATSPSYSKKLLMLEGISTMLEDAMTSERDTIQRDKIIDQLFQYASELVKIGDTKAEAIAAAMKEYQSSRYRFPEAEVQAMLTQKLHSEHFKSQINEEAKGMVTDYSIYDHGTHNPQYFAGDSSGDYEHIVIGSGHSLRSALEFAIEQVASEGYTIPENLENEIEKMSDADTTSQSPVYRVTYNTFSGVGMLTDQKFDDKGDAVELYNRIKAKMLKRGLEASYETPADGGSMSIEFTDPDDAFMVSDLAGMLRIQNITPEDSEDTEVEHYVSLKFDVGDLDESILQEYNKKDVSPLYKTGHLSLAEPNGEHEPATDNKPLTSFRPFSKKLDKLELQPKDEHEPLGGSKGTGQLTKALAKGVEDKIKQQAMANAEKDKNDPMLVHVKPNQGKKSVFNIDAGGKEQLYNSIRESDNMRDNLVKRLRIILENDVEQAEVLIAAKGFGQEIQLMVEKTGRLMNEDLQPVVDQMRISFGVEHADAFMNTMRGDLESVLETLRTVKENIDMAVVDLAGGQVPNAGNDMDAGMGDVAEPAIDDFGEITGVDGDMGEFDGSPAAAGPEDEALGREKKESMQADMLKQQLAEMRAKIATIKKK